VKRLGKDFAQRRVDRVTLSLRSRADLSLAALRDPI
jgi:hypothetical protein